MPPPPRRRRKPRAKCFVLLPVLGALTLYAYVVLKHFRPTTEQQRRRRSGSTTTPRRTSSARKRAISRRRPRPTPQKRTTPSGLRYRGPLGRWRTQERAPARASIHSAFTGSVVTNDSFVSIATQLAQANAPESRARQCRVDFTLVTQASAERLWMLDHICQRWHGPIVISALRADHERIQTARDKPLPESGGVHHHDRQAAHLQRPLVLPG